METRKCASARHPCVTMLLLLLLTRHSLMASYSTYKSIIVQNIYTAARVCWKIPNIFSAFLCAQTYGFSPMDSPKTTMLCFSYLSITFYCQKRISIYKFRIFFGYVCLCVRSTMYSPLNMHVRWCIERECDFSQICECGREWWQLFLPINSIYNI